MIKYKPIIIIYINISFIRYLITICKDFPVTHEITSHDLIYKFINNNLSSQYYEILRKKGIVKIRGCLER